MSKFAEYHQRRWNLDIETRDRLQEIRARMNYPDSAGARFCDERIAAIESRYPQHFKRPFPTDQSQERV